MGSTWHWLCQVRRGVSASKGCEAGEWTDDLWWELWEEGEEGLERLEVLMEALADCEVERGAIEAVFDSWEGEFGVGFVPPRKY